MKLVTWNIQCCLGCDGHAEPARIVEHARALADFDVLCLQEVCASFPALDGGRGEDQYEQLARLLPDYHAVPGVAVDLPGPGHTRRRLGNLILSRYPVRQVLRHALPRPPDNVPRSMPRMLLEATLMTPLGPLRVLTTHLEFHSAVQRAAQIEAIRQSHDDACRHAPPVPQAQSPQAPELPEWPSSPYQGTPYTSSALLTADFNFRPDDPLHDRLEAPFASGAPAFADTWRHLYPSQPHPATVGVHDRRQWPASYACDFVFATRDLLPRLEAVRVESTTQASDHQPVLVILN